MAKIQLKAITDGKDKNRYCGPSVISALTDLTTGEARTLTGFWRPFEPVTLLLADGESPVSD